MIDAGELTKVNSGEMPRPSVEVLVQRVQRLEDHVDRLHRAILAVLSEHEARIGRLSRIIDSTIIAPALLSATHQAPKH
jgi:uncharacterized protein Yka (UPF0111/DUF47 family)